MVRAWLLLVLPACLASTGCQQIFPLDPPAIDAPSTPIDEPPTLCFGQDLVQICLGAPPATPITVGTGGMLRIQTDNDAACLPYTVMGGVDPEACVIAGSLVQIDGTLRALGPRPLVVISGSTIAITGEVDVSSHRAIGEGAGSDPDDCVAHDASGRSGGAGASFESIGGNGGGTAGTPTTPTPTLPPPTGLRGGCRGGDGGGGSGVPNHGRGGGAVALIATTISITGVIDASGMGGQGGKVPTANAGGGGGGGGSGGSILIDGTLSLESTGQLLANGGGGGEGGGNVVGNAGCDGSESTAPTAAAAGGGTGAGCTAGGNGGAGALGTGDGAAAQGATGGDGGGGGGGGVGYVRIFPALQPVFGDISPPPS